MLPVGIISQLYFLPFYLFGSGMLFVGVIFLQHIINFHCILSYGPNEVVHNIGQTMKLTTTMLCIEVPTL